MARRVRRQLLIGIGVLGVYAFAPRILRSARAASGQGDGSSPAGGAAQRDVRTSDDLPRAALYEEGPNDPFGKRYSGVVMWTLIEAADHSGMLETSVSASVAIPERQMVMHCTLRRNDDKSLPASHTIEFAFTLPPDAPRGIGSVPGILMKSREDTRGTPLRGTTVKVTAGFYLVGLSAADAERAANVALLKEREWFDVPIVYDDGRRAILAFEKGAPGRRVLAQAFAAWEESPRPAPPPLPPRLQLPPDIVK